MPIQAHRRRRLDQLQDLLRRAPERMSVPRIAESLGVSQRTVHYDIGYLQNSGVRLSVVTGRSGGVLLESSPTRNSMAPGAASLEQGHLTIGFTDELQQARRLVEQSNAGKPRILVVTGEAGSGKSHLSRHIFRFGNNAGFHTVTTNCRQSAPAFWPWSQLVRSMPAVGHADDQQFAAIASAVPELSDLAADTSQNAASRVPDSASARFQLLQSFTQLVVSRVKSAPLMIRFEDMHWADQPSLDLLDFVTDAEFHVPVIIITTIRTLDTETQDHTARLMASLARLPSAERIDLNGLSQNETGELLETTCNQTPTTEQVETIFNITAGNPLFTIEYGRLLGSGATDRVESMPDVVREVITQRITPLSEACRRVLDAAAVIGEQFDGSVLDSIVENPAKGLDEARRAGLLAESSSRPGYSAFAHALIRDAVLDAMPLDDRHRLNLATARVLMRRRDRSGVGAVAFAHHMLESGPLVDPEDTALACLEAGEGAIQGHSYADASDWFRLALKLHGERKDPETARALDGLARSVISLHVGSAVQDEDEATDIYIRAFELYVALGNVDAAVALAVFPGGDNLRIHARVVEPAAKLAKQGTAERALLDAKRGMQLAEPRFRIEDHEYPHEALAASDRAIEVAEELDDDYVRMWAYQRRAYIHYNYIGWETSAQFSRPALKAAKNIDDPRGAAIVATYFAKSLAATGRLDGALVIAREAVDAAIRNRAPHGQWPAYANLATVLMMRGSYDQLYEPFEWWESQWSDGEPVNVVRAFVPAWQGDTGEVMRHVKRVVDSASPTAPLRATAMGWSVLMLARDSFDQSIRDVAVEASGRCLTSPPDPGTSLHISWSAGESARALLSEDLPAAERMYEVLLRYRGLAEPGFWSHFCVIDPLLGELAALLGENDAVREHFDDALRFCRDGAYLPDLARTCFLYARQNLNNPAQLDPYETRKLLDEGERTAVENDLGMVLDQIRPLKVELKRKLKLGELRPAGLTRTEVRVLQLIVRGSPTRRSPIHSLSAAIRSTHTSQASSVRLNPSVARRQSGSHGHQAWPDLSRLFISRFLLIFRVPSRSTFVPSPQARSPILTGLQVVLPARSTEFRRSITMRNQWNDLPDGRPA